MSPSLGFAPARSRVAVAVALALVAAVFPACGVPETDPQGLIETESSVIGGSLVSVSNQRTLGLLRMSSALGTCSASLISPTWAIAAAHCFHGDDPSDHVFSILQSNGVTTDSRTASLIARIGNTDIAMAELAIPNVVQDWPNVARAPLRNPTPSGLTNQNVTCYGRGSSGYATPSGLTNDNKWRSLVKTVTFDGTSLVASSNNGTNTTAPGDSGGPCLYNNLLAGIDSWNNSTCADNSTPARCEATITKILRTGAAATGLYADYIAYAPSRANLHFYPLTLAANWVAPTLSGNLPGYGISDAAVHLRGAINASGTDTVAFTLPMGARPDAQVDLGITLCGGNKGRLEVRPDGTATISAETTWTNAQCLTSLDGVQFDLSPFGATALTPINGWGSAPPPFRVPAVRVANGVARLQGAITQGTSPTLPAFTLPAAARPTAAVDAPVDLCGAKKGRISINTSGQAVITAASGDPLDAACFTSLEGVTYLVNPNQPQPLTFLNGWKSAPFRGTPSVTNVNGIIRFRGAITAGTTGQAFQLTGSMRPATNVYIPVDLTNGARGRLKVQPDGYVIVQAQAAFADAASFTSLEGASFGL